MAEKKEPQVLKEPHSILSKIEVPYRYFVGTMATQFYIELRDNKKIMGVKCPQCNKVIMPPKSVCLKCFSKLDEWVEVGNKGTVEGYSIINYDEPINPMKAPFAYALIKLDGADTALLHVLGEVDLRKISTGMRVEPVFAEEPKGSILTIKYFKPI